MDDTEITRAINNGGFTSSANTNHAKFGAYHRYAEHWTPMLDVNWEKVKTLQDLIGILQNSKLLQIPLDSVNGIEHLLMIEQDQISDPEQIIRLKKAGVKFFNNPKKPKLYNFSFDSNDDSE